MMLMISYILKTIKLILLLFNQSYIFGIGWLIFCELNQEFEQYLRSDIKENDPERYNNMNNEYFLSYFNLDGDWRTRAEKVIISSYYGFTTLTTIGFGDYHPRSDNERLLCSFIFLFGVSVFSYILNNFLEILIEFKHLNEDLDDGVRLA